MVDAREKVLTSKNNGKRRQEAKLQKFQCWKRVWEVKSRKAKHLTTQDSSK